MVTTTTPRLTGLPRCLVEAGLLSEAQARQALAQAEAEGRPFVSQVAQAGLARPAAVALAAARGFGLPLLDLEAVDLAPETVRLVEERLIRKHQALPVFRRGHRLFVALADPADLEALDEIRFQSGLAAEAVVAAQDQLARVIEQALEAEDSALAGLDDAALDDLEVSAQEEEGGPELPAADVDDTPVVRFVNKLLLDAVNRGASDIHFEPYEDRFRVRFRLDGLLREVASPPAALTPKIVARLKVMAHLDISERRLPQDGRIRMRLSRSNQIDFRVNTCPTVHGEKVVLRLLDGSRAQLDVEQLGLEPEQKEALLQAVHLPYGMVLVTGPTGSGKTVTLYSCLHLLNSPERNISTVEDPVEINVPGINQVNINPKAGLSFASALRAFLRQDPDVIMVGEIRDLETAEIAVKAAQTGHMVFSTLHTNDAPQAITRLADMGLPPFAISASVSLVVAQRLARRLCPHCRAPAELPPEALLREGFAEEELEGLQLYRAVGCEQCNGGYKGRTGIYQVMPVSEAMRRLILAGEGALALAEQARAEGVADLRASGLKKVRAGVTSLEELNRVITV
ncbi:MAG: type IV-A pilus assembly ATPase PilB [Gammaproteobacteria bacterium]|nr:MAG: type IV-A pilus assembly ATPase PilB [Gammaproteobacteria bacterium]